MDASSHYSLRCIFYTVAVIAWAGIACPVIFARADRSRSSNLMANELDVKATGGGIVQGDCSDSGWANGGLYDAGDSKRCQKKTV